MNRSATFATVAVALLAALVLPGCITRILDPPEPRFSDPLSEFEGFGVPSGNLTGPLPASALSWPRFADDDGDCATLRILDHGAFAAFEAAAARFEELTCARVVHDEADDTGDALRQAIEDVEAPQYDVLYGIDNALLARAVEEGVFQPYTPQLAARVAPGLVFFGDAFAEWPATPVDHGYVAVNWDPVHEDLEGEVVGSLHDLVRLRGSFVTEDPRTSTPGLGFLLLTIGRFGEEGAYTWRHYWGDLLERGNTTQNATAPPPALVTADWATAYEKHYSGGYGRDQEGHLGDRPIVTSYTESPAYEWYWDEVHPRATQEYDPGYKYQSDPARLPRVLLDPEGSVFHQVQTMGVLQGARNRAVAEAWVEFTLTDDFQRLAAKENAVYPVVAAVDTDDVYTDKDPAPGPFIVDVPWFHIGDNLERWLQEWTALCEQHDCA